MTLPSSLRDHVGIAVGDILEATVERDRITLTPKSIVDRDIGESLEDLHVLELGLQGLITDRVSEEAEESVLWITGSLDGGFIAEIRHDGENFHIDNLNLPNLNDANFVWAMYHLSLSPEVNLNRLDAIASQAVDVRLRAQGLVTVAMGALTRAFKTKTD